MELKAKEIQTMIDSGNPTLVICVAAWCKHCQGLKENISEIKELSSQYGINLELMTVTDKENESFIMNHPFETLPYCLVFVNKEFKGGEEAKKDMLEELIPALSDAVQRDVLNNPEYQVIA